MKFRNIICTVAALGAICMSTVFLKQHSVVDVFWACVLGLVLYPLSYKSAFDDSRESEYNVKAS